MSGEGCGRGWNGGRHSLPDTRSIAPPSALFPLPSPLTEEKCPARQAGSTLALLMERGIDVPVRWAADKTLGAGLYRW